jgi:hypothetical protein
MVILGKGEPQQLDQHNRGMLMQMRGRHDQKNNQFVEIRSASNVAYVFLKPS